MIVKTNSFLIIKDELYCFVLESGWILVNQKPVGTSGTIVLPQSLFSQPT